MSNHHHYTTVAAALRYLRAHHLGQPSLGEVAAAVHLSKYHFQRVFREWAGLTPKQFLAYLTLNHAKRGLLRGRTTLDAAYAAGLSGTGRLHDLFVRMEACTPGEFARRGAELTLYYGRVSTPFGPGWVAETDRGISRFVFADWPTGADAGAELGKEFPAARLVAHRGPYGDQLADYFTHWKTPTEPLPLDLRGTPFRVSIWRALLEIPASDFKSYGDLAKRVGNPRASQAVGSAVGANPVAYLIPCHRVIRETGELGGYRWGLERKQAMHAFEGARFAEAASAELLAGAGPLFSDDH